MKLTILGGGGFRVPLVHEAVATAATGLTVDEIALHDVDPERLATISAVIDPMTRPEWPRTSSAASGLRFCGMIDDPVE